MGAGTHSCVGSAPRWSVDPPACAPPSARTSPRTMSIVGSSLPATRPARTGPAPTAGNAVLARPRVNGRGAADAGQRSPMGRAVVVPLGASMGRGWRSGPLPVSFGELPRTPDLLLLLSPVPARCIEVLPANPTRSQQPDDRWQCQNQQDKDDQRQGDGALDERHEVAVRDA